MPSRCTTVGDRRPAQALKGRDAPIATARGPPLVSNRPLRLIPRDEAGAVRHGRSGRLSGGSGLRGICAHAAG